jgi:hypothetical protein
MENTMKIYYLFFSIAFSPVGQFWYGTPVWFKTTIVSGSGRIGD